MDERYLRYVLSMNLKKYRGYRKLSQAELAEKLDISIPFLSDIENGKKWVSPRTLAKIAEVFNIEAYELLRPEQTLPDSPVNILEQYTADVYAIFGQTLDELYRRYTDQLREPVSKL
jgi:transcriptional regulator with XRE-family HTH domain